ncbi:MAG: electron transfer flavoprotein subunit alpha/FixB family protein [Clostridia bacterium]|nr:electron transfer flavoprotein subunit alpha/FixB family protein [Clostridia bacterium]
MDDSRDVWVIMETVGGRLSNVGFEILGQGRLLADTIGERLVAVIVSDDPLGLASEAIEYGADAVLAVSDKRLGHYSTELFTQAVCSLAEKCNPEIVMMGATCQGRDLAPRVACRLKTGLTADCTSLEIDNRRIVRWTRPAFGGNLMSTNICPVSKPQMGTVRPGVFRRPARQLGRTGEIFQETVYFKSSPAITKIKDVFAVEGLFSSNLAEARIIISGGRGLQGRDNFDILRELAKAVGGSVGASRAAVDAGWISPVYQIGQTGKAVSPKVYFACGINHFYICMALPTLWANAEYCTIYLWN